MANNDDENNAHQDKKNNVIPLKVPRKSNDQSRDDLKKGGYERSKWSQINHETPPSKHHQSYTPDSEAFINLPPYTKYLLGVILGIHIILNFLLDTNQINWAFVNLGFIPGRFTDTTLFEPLAFITPLTHMFLHGSWLHIAMNSIMLLAFGAGVEKWLGGKTMLKLFVFSALFGLAFHFALNFHSHHPMIGASGGLSGLFAVAITMLNRQNTLPMGKYGFLPLILLWVGISVLFGSMGSPDGSQIAWAAHVGGFIGGFILMKWMKI